MNGHRLVVTDPENGECGCIDCGAEPRHTDWSQPCPAHLVRLARREWCAGSRKVPHVSTFDGHGLCNVCELPSRLTSGVIPDHRGVL